MTRPSFGRDMRHQHFLFEHEFVNFNHGSLGTYPKSVRQRLREIQDDAEAAPDRFKRYDLPRLLHESHVAIAGFLRISSEELFYVESAASATELVLRSLQFEPEDLIVYFDTINCNTQNIIARSVETTSAGALELHVTYPTTDRQITQLFQSTLQNNRGRVKLAVFETTAAFPAARLPFESLASIAREEGVLTLIDGAHGVGHLPLDLATLKPDFFVSECHKWLFTPRCCIILYVRRLHHEALRNVSLPCHLFGPGLRMPAASSSGFPPLSPDTSSRTTSDTASPRTRLANSDCEVNLGIPGFVASMPYLCIPEALRFRQDVCGGETEIMNYCADLSRRMAIRVASILFTSSLEGDFVQDCCMFNVMLPLKIVGDEPEGLDEIMRQMLPLMTSVPPEQATFVTDYITDKMVQDYQLFIAIFVYRGIWWARFSTQVYLEEEDFERGARALKAICLEIREGRHLQ